MRIKGVYVEIYLKESSRIYLGGIVLDCGIEICGIHFSKRENSFYVNYPAVRDKNRIFHPSFCILNNEEDNKIKQLLTDAWKRAEQTGKSVYGYCEEGQDFAWIDEKWSELNPSAVLQQLPVTIKLTRKRTENYDQKIAYGRIYIDSWAVINNVKVYLSKSGEIEVQFPGNGKEEVVRFYSEDDRIWLRQYIIEQFQNLDPPQNTVVIENNDYKDPLREGGEEDELFRILWDASDNGYILQSQIRGILQKNQIDWQKKYQVQRISELIEKMDFMSRRRLETRPEHFVDWVAISYEKDSESQTSTGEKVVNLSDDVRAMLYEALNRKYNVEGKINLAGVIPYMQEEFPHLMEKLPKVKLKVILKSCDFVTFEGGPMPPIYIHIKSLGSRQEDEKETKWQGEEGKVWDANQLIENQSKEFCQLTSESQSEKMEHLEKTKTLEKFQSEELEHQTDTEKKEEYSGETNNKEEERTEKYFCPAQNNPFTYVKNTKLLLASKIPDENLPSVNSDEAMRKLLTMTSLGQLDSMDLELVYWVSNLQYAKSTFLYDLIIGGFIPIPSGKKISKDKLSKRLMRLYKLKLIEYYKFCSVTAEGVITNKANHRVLMLTGYGRTQLKMIGRQSTFDYFMPLDNIEKILGKLSVNQWFTKFIMIFKDAFYYFDTVLTAKIAEANAARISLIINKDGIPVFVRAFKRGNFHNDSVRSGEFDFWIKRVSSLLQNYHELYVEAKRVEYKKVPKVIFICENLEHCFEIYQQIKDTTEKIGNTKILESLWFAEDLNIYNDFLHAHFCFTDGMDMLPMSLEDFLEVRVDGAIDFELGDFTEQTEEEDTRILAELDYEDTQMEYTQI